MAQTVRNATTSDTGRDERSYSNLEEIVSDQSLSAGEAAWMCLRRYAQERPEVVALWTFGLGFILGWKLRIW